MKKKMCVSVDSCFFSKLCSKYLAIFGALEGMEAVQVLGDIIRVLSKKMQTVQFLKKNKFSDID